MCRAQGARDQIYAAALEKVSRIYLTLALHDKARDCLTEMLFISRHIHGSNSAVRRPVTGERLESEPQAISKTDCPRIADSGPFTSWVIVCT